MFVCLLALTLAAAPAAPLTVVKNGNEQVRKILAGTEATAAKLAAKADEFIDFAELARRALGTQWARLDKKQQAEFTDTMKGLLRASYAQKALQDGKGGQEVAWGAEKVTGNEATVKSVITVGADKFPVEYRLYRAAPASAWRIYDVVTDEVSLLSTYSDQFRQLISKKGYDGLLTSLKSRRDQLEQQSGEKKTDVAVPPGKVVATP